MNKRAHVIFSGRVQGVFFRANTYEKARATGLRGWVRNLRDGTVEAVLEGDENTIKEVIRWCKKSQPHARVDSAKIIWEEFKSEFRDFEIRH